MNCENNIKGGNMIRVQQYFVFASTMILSVFATHSFAMGKRPVVPSEEFKESSAGNCPALAEFAKKPVWSLPSQHPSRADSILVDKKRRMLHLISEGKLLRTYQIALGGKPTGKKNCEGDNRTPEGVYNIDFKNSASDFHLSLQVSYPSQDDINRARQLGCDPGGEIMVHGLPNNPIKRKLVRHPRDWTKGCMAVRDGEIEEIYSLIDKGSEIEICP